MLINLTCIKPSHHIPAVDTQVSHTFLCQTCSSLSLNPQGNILHYKICFLLKFFLDIFGCPTEILIPLWPVWRMNLSGQILCFLFPLENAVSSSHPGWIYVTLDLFIWGNLWFNYQKLKKIVSNCSFNKCRFLFYTETRLLACGVNKEQKRWRVGLAWVPFNRGESIQHDKITNWNMDKNKWTTQLSTYIEEKVKPVKHLHKTNPGLRNGYCGN